MNLFDVANHLADRWAEKAQEKHWLLDVGEILMLDHSAQNQYDGWEMH